MNNLLEKRLKSDNKKLKSKYSTKEYIKKQICDDFTEKYKKLFNEINIKR